MTERDDWARRTAVAGRETTTTGPVRTGSPPRAAGPSSPSGGRTETLPRVSRSSAPGVARGTRRARLTLRRVDPFSAMKFSAVMAVVLFLMWVVAVALLYGVLAGMGVFDQVNQTIGQFTGSATLGSLFTARSVIGAAIVVGLINAVLFVALSTLGAFVYNLCADLVGGVEVTLSEAD